MLVVYVVSIVFQITIYLLKSVNIKVQKCSEYTSFKVMYFSLILITIIVQDITRRTMHYCELETYLSEIILQIIKTSMIPCIFNLYLLKLYHSDGSLVPYLGQFNERIYKHRVAAIIAVIYFLIPKNYDKLDSHMQNLNNVFIVHFVKNAGFIVNISLSIFMSPIINDSTKLKPHSIVCNAIHYVLHRIISHLFSLHNYIVSKTKNNVLLCIQFANEFKINLSIYNGTLFIINCSEKCILYIIITTQKYYKNKSFMFFQQFIAFIIGYYIIFIFILSFILNGFFGDIALFIKCIISLSVGNWILFSLIFIHIFPTKCYVFNEIEMGFEILLNGFIWLSLFATLNTSVHIRNIIIIPLGLLCFFFRCKQSYQICVNNESDQQSYLYDSSQLQKLKIFKYIENIRINFHHLSYPILLPYIMNDIPLEIIQIILDYIDIVQSEKMLEIKWKEANENINLMLNIV